MIQLFTLAFVTPIVLSIFRLLPFFIWYKSKNLDGWMNGWMVNNLNLAYTFVPIHFKVLFVLLFQTKFYFNIPFQIHP